MGWKLADFQTAVQTRIGTAATVDQEIEDAVFYLSRIMQLEMEEAHATTVSAGLTSISRPWDGTKVECVYIPAQDLEIYEISLADKRKQQSQSDKVYFWMSHDDINFTRDLSEFANVGDAIYTRYLQNLTVPTASVEYNGPDPTIQIIVAIAAYFWSLRRVAEYLASPSSDFSLSEMQSTARLFGEAMDEQLANVEKYWRQRRYAGRPEPSPVGRSDD